MAGAAIQLKFQMDGHVAALLAMTNRVHRLLHPTADVGPALALAMTNV